MSEQPRVPRRQSVAIKPQEYILQTVSEQPNVPRRQSVAVKPQQLAVAATPRQSAPAAPSEILPPDREKLKIIDNTKRRTSVAVLPQQQLLTGVNRRTSVVQQPSTVVVQFPDKSRKHSVIRVPLQMQLQLQTDSTQEQHLPVMDKSKRSSMGTDPIAKKLLQGGSGGGEFSSAGMLQLKKRPPNEVQDYYSQLRTIRVFRKSQSAGSLTSFDSTISSISSIYSEVSRVGVPIMGSENGQQPEWALRWVVDKAGKQPGQIKCVKDVCFLRNGDIAVTESKNSRVQVFSRDGKSMAILGAESDNDRTSKSFSNPMSFRKMQPTGICETTISNLIVVTDLNRLLYMEVSKTGGELGAEIIVKDKTSLRGVAATQTSKLILSEVGTQASVGLYETGGRLVREFKGDFKQPAYLAWNEEYEVAAVSDSEQHVVYLYDINGHLLTKLGQRSELAAGQNGGSEDEVAPLIYPSGVCWLTEGRLLVADRAENRVVLFDLRNMAAANVLTDEDGINQPVALATNMRNRIVVTEEFYDFGVDKYQLKLFKHRMHGYLNDI